MTLPLIDTGGTPYEIGRQHGLQAAQRVRGAYERFCRPETGHTPERVELRQVMEAAVARRAPQAIEEMQGIADGAGLEYGQVRDLNFSIELWSESFLGAPPPRGCTLLEVSSDKDGLLIGKTMDVTPGDNQYLVIQRVRPEAGLAFLHVTYAGTIWTDGGVNAAGLAEVNSSLEAQGLNLEGYPVFLMTRDLLQHCQGADQAARLAAESDAVNFGSNILLADAGGAVAVVERSVGCQAVRRPADSERPTLFATNHNQTPELDEALGGSATLVANSRERFERLKRIPGGLPRTREALEDLLRDHSRPGGLCQHGQGDLHTIGAFIASPSLKQVWVADGPPCENPFEPVSLW